MLNGEEEQEQTVITELKLKNFRGIKEGALKLAPQTIILGPNNSAKSTILEALFLVSNPFRDVPYVSERRNAYWDRCAAKVLHSIHKTLDSIGYAFLMHNYVEKEAEIECRSNGETYLMSFMADERNRYLNVCTNQETSLPAQEYKDRWYVGYLGLYDDFVSVRDDRMHNLLLAPNTLLVTAGLMHMAYEYFRDFWSSITNQGISSKAIQKVSELVREKYEDMTLEPFGGRLSLNAYLKDRRRIRLGDLGEGLQVYSSARMLVEIEKPKVLLWDDVEAHLNPKILLSIGDWFSELIEEGNQVILTTHSLEAARIIAGLNEENTRIYLVDLRNNVLRSEEYTLEKLEEYYRAGIDIRTAEAML